MFRLYRVILPVFDIERAAAFYAHLLDTPGERVSPGRHYFDCGGVILACFDPQADGDGFDARSNQEHLYFAIDDLDATYERASQSGCQWVEEGIATRPWGERSFYVRDPFGNPLCFVDASTVFTGHS